jgi:formate hydrogenlyase transcriptional activator
MTHDPGHEVLRYRALLDIIDEIASHHDPQSLLHDLSGSLHAVIRFDWVGVFLYDSTRDVVISHVLEGIRPQDSDVGPGFEIPAALTVMPEVLESQTALIVSDMTSLEPRFPQMTSLLYRDGVRSFCVLPLTTARGRLGGLGLGSAVPAAFDAEDVPFLQRVAAQVAVALENALAFQEIAGLKDKLAQEKVYLEDEIRTELHFDEIIGESAALKRVLDQVERVACSDSTVLILGETGTGKELIARAIHNRSKRSQRTFVKLNCAAIPTGLLESELFGHERGAFTGAVERKIGRLELAHQGTLFLDEVGDIPLELQPKLLRALQEREFERLGSARTLKVDVRLVAATNRNLQEMVGERQFRSDLYYRLNVFPVHVPPLRERTEDIPLLVRHFVRKHTRRMDKHIETVPAAAMQALMHWPWPGNIRELENVIERAVILSRGQVLNLPTAELAMPLESYPANGTLADAEREHIVRALRETGGVVGGPAGAAARLGLKRTTLISRMKKLGI